MPKLPHDKKFLDFSDYGRRPARWIANQLKDTKTTAIHITLLFFLCGLFGAYFIYKGHYVFAGISLILKSILDAADGELARLKKKPSFIGRYLDSVLDFVLNFLILYAISNVAGIKLSIFLVCFFVFQLQGTVYNYYYLIVRNYLAGADKTSRVNENSFPQALHGENQKVVNLLFVFYTIFYRGFDLIVIALDRTAQKVNPFPNWFMSLISVYGLGFQLLIISTLLFFGLIDVIIPFFIVFTGLIPIIFLIRKSVLKTT